MIYAIYISITYNIHTIRIYIIYSRNIVYSFCNKYLFNPCIAMEKCKKVFTFCEYYIHLQFSQYQVTSSGCDG